MADIRFSEEDRQGYYQETYESLGALLADTLEGDDQNQIKDAFPPGCTLDDIEIVNTRISLSFMNNEEDPIIESIIQIGYKGEAIGEYAGIYNPDGSLADESFYIEA